nr:MAG: nonstructural protein [Microvirus sp.]
MMLKLFCVFDSKVGSYLPPFSARTAGEAIRMFESSVKQEKSQMALFATDYSLFEVGSFDDQLATFEFPKAPAVIATASQFVE